MPTISVENYLKTIYHLQQRADGAVKTKAIADHLALSLPSVTSMLKGLSDDALVEYTPYRGARLTERGERLALQVIRKHRLVELFLVQTLSYTWDEVHAEAERLEHAISDELAARMEAYLAFPRFDPHGDPIPDAHGKLPSRDTMPLSQAPHGVPLRLRRVLDQDAEVLRYLHRVGLVPDATLIIREILPFDGQVALTLSSGDPLALSRELAARLLVRVQEPEAA